MPGTRNAPTVDGTPNFRIASFSFIGAREDRKSISFPFAGDTTDLELEAIATALQAGSNGSMWRIQVTDDYSAVPIVSNAVDAQYSSLQDNVLISYKNPTTRATEFFYVPAPIASMLLAGSEEVDTADATFTALLAAIAPALPVGMSPVTTRFTEHREMNATQPIG